MSLFDDEEENEEGEASKKQRLKRSQVARKHKKAKKAQPVTKPSNQFISMEMLCPSAAEEANEDYSHLSEFISAAQAIRKRVGKKAYSMLLSHPNKKSKP